MRQSKKSLLQGLGIGIMVGAILLQLVVMSDRSDALPVDETKQLQELTKEADELGYKIVKKDEPIYTQQHLDDGTIITKDQMDKLLKDANPATSKSIYAFTIASGSDSLVITDMLADMQLIDSKEQFSAYLEMHELSNKLQRGYFIFHQKPSMEELVKELTTPKQ